MSWSVFQGGGYYEGGRGGGDYYRGEGGDGTVVMVYGIDQTNFNCDKLFNLLCLYGNCERVRFIFIYSSFSLKYNTIPD